MPLKPNRLLFALGTFVAFVGCASTPPVSRPPGRQNDAYVGMSETSICARLGRPSREFAGYYGLPSTTFTSRFSGEIKSLVFKNAEGEHYVTLEKRSKGWIAINSSWLPKGGVF